YDDFVASSKKGRIDALVGSSVLEQRRDMNPGLMGKNIGADDGLRAADVAPRRASDDPRQCLQSPGVDIGATARDMTKRHDDFLKRGVAGAFAQTKHRHRSVQGARADRRQRIGGRQSHVVVPVKLYWQVSFFPHALDRLIGAERIEKAQSVRETKARGALLRGRAQNLSDVSRIGARGVLAAESNGKVARDGVGDDASHPFRRAIDVDAELHANLQSRHGRGYVDVTN